MNTKKSQALRIVVDTNIIVSALNFGGPPDRVIIYCTTSAAQLYLSPFILHETQNVLTRKFGWHANRAHRTIELLKRQATMITPTDRLSLVTDEADNRILECAQAVSADYLVTGDQELLNLKKVNGTAIVSAARFLNVV
ncbi:MAG: putative toxin-antitoxin system toxin component, PIN family [Candidatus Andersenbacteria bacterium]|nr:putative toxin-antitoxin system toxin component, PIN family [Candidatus Andersenbacteria bacterium]